MSDPLLGLGVFGGVLVLAVLVAGFITVRQAATRALRARALRQGVAGKAAAEVVPVHDSAGRGPLLAVLTDGRIAVQEDPASDRSPMPRKVTGASFVQNATGPCALRVAVEGGKEFFVAGLDPMMRAYSQLRQAGTDFQYDLAGKLGDRAKVALGKLHFKEQEILVRWLVRTEELQEFPLEVLDEVDYEGATRTPGSRGKCRLLVTNFRLGLLAQTQTSVQSGNTITTTTHFSVIGYALPMAERVTVRRSGKIRKGGFLWELAHAPEHAPAAGQEPPKLLLAESHGAALLPVSLCAKPLGVQETVPTTGRLIREVLWGGLGFGLLGAVLAGVPVWVWWGSGGGNLFWLEEWIPFVFLGGLWAGVLLRALGTVERFAERRADAAIAAPA